MQFEPNKNGRFIHEKLVDLIAMHKQYQQEHFEIASAEGQKYRRAVNAVVNLDSKGIEDLRNYLNTNKIYFSQDEGLMPVLIERISELPDWNPAKMGLKLILESHTPSKDRSN